jgi:hypothetical protein
LNTATSPTNKIDPGGTSLMRNSFFSMLTSMTLGRSMRRSCLLDRAARRDVTPFLSHAGVSRIEASATAGSTFEYVPPPNEDNRSVRSWPHQLP